MTVGDRVIIRDGDTEHEAEVYSVAPHGHFSVHWYAGSNRFAPWLPGHWYAEFKPDGARVRNESRWEFVGLVDEIEQERILSLSREEVQAELRAEGVDIESAHEELRRRMAAIRATR